MASHPEWVKNSFVLAFYMLIRYGKDPENAFKNAMAETIALGGHSDTHACIVGGMIGALVGKKGIPIEMRNKVLNCDLSKG